MQLLMRQAALDTGSCEGSIALMLGGKLRVIIHAKHRRFGRRNGKLLVDDWICRDTCLKPEVLRKKAEIESRLRLRPV